MNDDQIARKVGCCSQTAGFRRKWLIVTAAETGGSGREFICEQPIRRKAAPDWSLLDPQDWVTLSNIRIARKLGCPVYRVTYQRQQRIAEEKRNRRKNRTSG